MTPCMFAAEIQSIEHLLKKQVQKLPSGQYISALKPVLPWQLHQNRLAFFGLPERAVPRISAWSNYPTGCSIALFGR